MEYRRDTLMWEWAKEVCMRKENTVCPVCANECGHVSKDGGATFQCDFCMGVWDSETEARVA